MQRESNLGPLDIKFDALLTETPHFGQNNAGAGWIKPALFYSLQ